MSAKTMKTIQVGDATLQLEIRDGMLYGIGGVTVNR